MRGKTMLLRAIILSALVAGNTVFGAEESLPPLRDGIAPQTFEALWAGYPM